VKISSIRWGIILLGIGLVFLAINFGYLDYFVWMRLLSLWPVLVIAIGLELIFKRTKLQFMALLSPLLLALTFLYVSSVDWQRDGYHFYYRWDNKDYEQHVYHYSLEREDDIDNLEVDIDMGPGYFRVSSSDDELFVGDFEYHHEKPRCRFDKYENKGKIFIKTRDRGGYSIFRGSKYKNDARIFIADYLPLDMKIDVAAARLELDLSELIVKKLKLDTGAGDIKIKLGSRSDKVFLRIDSGASRIKIIVPEEMGLKIDSDIALSSTNFRRMGLEKHRGYYRSENFSTADCRALIDIDSGVSQIKIDYY